MSQITVSRKIHFKNSRRSRKVICPGEKPKRKKTRTPRISRLMALAIHFNQMIRSGQIENMATLATYGQITRARITQIMNLLHLAPDIQESLLTLPETTTAREPVTIRDLQPLAQEPDWQVQRAMWEEVGVCCSRSEKNQGNTSNL